MTQGSKKEIPNYLCFTALEDGTFTFTIGANVPTSNLMYIEYSIDGGESWTHTDNVDSERVVITTPLVMVNEQVLWRGVGVSTSVSTANPTAPSDSVFSSSGAFDVSGCLCSLLRGDDASLYDELPQGASTFYGLFYVCSTIINAKDLIFPSNTREYCYKRFMSNCPNLLSISKLPANDITGQCYNSMFYGCTSLRNSPDVMATTGYGAYLCQQMFNGCLAMDYIKVLFIACPSSTAFMNWTTNVAASGIFVKHISATWTDTGVSGVPSNWTIIYYDPAEDKYYTSQDKSQECDDHGNPI